MSTDADNVIIRNLVWAELTKINSVRMLCWGAADIYLSDADGDELNLELEEDAAKALRDELLRLYPLHEEGEVLAPAKDHGQED